MVAEVRNGKVKKTVVGQDYFTPIFAAKLGIPGKKLA